MLTLHPRQIALGIGREIRGGDEHALAGPLAGQAADELLNRRPPHLDLGRVALGLNKDRIQPQRVFVDDAVDATYSGGDLKAVTNERATESTGTPTIATLTCHGAPM